MRLVRLFRGALCVVPLACGGSPAHARPTLRVDRVVMLMRHGVRAPLEGEVPDGTRTATPWPRWPVAQSRLTDHGAQAMAILGRSDRRRFAALGLMKATQCPRPRAVTIHANTAERAISSGKAYVSGFAPSCAITVDHLAQDRTDPIFEPLRAGATRFDGVAAVAAIDRQTGGIDALTHRHAAAIALLDRTLGCGVPEGCTPTGAARIAPSADGRGIDFTGPIRATSGTAQVLLLQYAEGLGSRSDGWGHVDAATLRRLGVLHAALFDVFTRSPYMAAHQAAVLGRHMLAALADARGPRIDVLVGHDTNVTALAAVLGIDLVAPGYAVNDVAPGGALMLERLHDAATGRRYVRVSYRTQSPEALRSLSADVTVTPVAVPGCGNAIDPCDLATFDRLVGSRLAALR